MARRVNTYEFKRTRGRTMYPWDQWLDGSIWSLTPGEDFDPGQDGKADSFRSSAQNAAKRAGGKVRSEWNNDRLMLQFYEEK